MNRFLKSPVSNTNNNTNSNNNSSNNKSATSSSKKYTNYNRNGNNTNIKKENENENIINEAINELKQLNRKLISKVDNKWYTLTDFNKSSLDAMEIIVNNLEEINKKLSNIENLLEAVVAQLMEINNKK